MARRREGRRLVTVIRRLDEAVALVRWCRRLAPDDADLVTVVAVTTRRGSQGEVTTVSDPGDDGLLQAAQAADGELELARLVAARPALPLRRFLAEQAPDLLVLAWHGRRGEEQPLGLELLHRSPCDALLLRLAPDSGLRCGRVLVPAAGGVHARRALVRLVPLVEPGGAELVLLNLQPPTVADHREVGLYLLRRLAGEAGIAQHQGLALRVETASRPGQRIREIAGEGFDLVVVGASEASLVERTVSQTLDEHLLGRADGPSLAVFHRGRSRSQRAIGHLHEWLEEHLPRLEREDRVALTRTLEDGSHGGRDFVTLMLLATALAALGLVADAGAVVVGAMLVAPLMTPIIGTGLGLVQGNLILVRTALASVGLGFLLALGVGIAVGLVVPGVRGAELAARATPTLLDLLVGAVSGCAGAYALARPKVGAALPGVAIAAALVPPVAAVGIGIARGDWAGATGAALLFATNVVAIVLAAAGTLQLLGMRPTGRSGLPLWVRRLIILFALVASLLLVPLLLNAVRVGRARPAELPDGVKAAVTAVLGRHGARLERVVLEPGHRRILVVASAPSVLTAQVVDGLLAALATSGHGALPLRLETRLVYESSQGRSRQPSPAGQARPPATTTGATVGSSGQSTTAPPG